MSFAGGSTRSSGTYSAVQRGKGLAHRVRRAEASDVTGLAPDKQWRPTAGSCEASLSTRDDTLGSSSRLVGQSPARHLDPQQQKSLCTCEDLPLSAPLSRGV